MLTKLFVRSRILNIFRVFTILSYFGIPENIQLNSTQLLPINIPNKKIPYNQPFNNHSKELIEIYKDTIQDPYSSRVTDTTFNTVNKLYKLTIKDTIVILDKEVDVDEKTIKS